jgi:hypothetical protein
MHVCGIAGQQYASVPVGRGLSRHIGESGDRGRTVNPVIGPVDRDEGLAEIAQRRLGSPVEVLLRHQDPHRSSILQFGERMDAASIAANAPFRLLDQLDLGDQVADGWIPARELDAGGFADQAASAVTADEISRPDRPASSQLDIDAGVVLRQPRHLPSAIDRHRQLAGPIGQYALDVLLPQSEPVMVPGGKVADVQTYPGKTRDLGHLSLREEPVGNAALIEDLDGT